MFGTPVPALSAVVRIAVERPTEPIAERGAGWAFARTLDAGGSARAGVPALPAVERVGVQKDALASTKDLIAQDAGARPGHAVLVRPALREACAAMQP